MIQNGDRVEIMTSQNSRGPSRDWLKIVKSSQAKSKINQWFKAQNREDNIARGREAILSYCRSKGIKQEDVLKPKYIEECLKKYHYPDWEGVLASVGHGGLKEGQVVNRLLEELRKENQAALTDEDILRNIEESSKIRVRTVKDDRGILVRGLHDLSVRFSHCCSPVPGDEIIGFITRGRGISIHRTDCPNILALPDNEKVRLIPADWSEAVEKGSGGKYETHIQIYCNNRIGMFADITRIMTESNIDIQAASSRVSKAGTATIHMGFEVASIEEVNQLIAKLRMIPGVMDIERTAG